MFMRYNPIKRGTLLFGMVFIFLMSACGGDDGPTPEELRLQELTATWTLDSVVNDGQDVSNQFNGFSLTVTSQQTYTTTNGGNAWPAQGTFSLVTNNLDEFTRDDDINVSIVSIDESSLTLSFQVTGIRTSVSGTEGITGSFTFNLNKTN